MVSRSRRSESYPDAARARTVFDAGEDVIVGKLDVLARHCEDAGRDPDSVQKTVISGTDPLADVDSFRRGHERLCSPRRDQGMGRLQGT